MFLTTKGRYAVMIMVALAEQEGDNISAQNLTVKLGIEVRYLEQILSKLRIAGVVRSIRGPGGGYALSRDSADIKIIDIMMAVKESFKMTRCGAVAGAGCMEDKTICNTHHLWEDLEKQIARYLEGTTLKAVCSKSLCDSQVARFNKMEERDELRIFRL